MPIDLSKFKDKKLHDVIEKYHGHVVIKRITNAYEFNELRDSITGEKLPTYISGLGEFLGANDEAASTQWAKATKVYCAFVDGSPIPAAIVSLTDANKLHISGSWASNKYPGIGLYCYFCFANKYHYYSDVASISREAWKTYTHLIGAKHSAELADGPYIDVDAYVKFKFNKNYDNQELRDRHRKRLIKNQTPADYHGTFRPNRWDVNMKRKKSKQFANVIVEGIKGKPNKKLITPKQLQENNMQTKVRAGKLYVYSPVGYDRADPKTNLKKGEVVMTIKSPHGCPPMGTMGHCYVGDAKTGEFIGLVMMASLQPYDKNNAELQEGLSIKDYHMVELPSNMKEKMLTMPESGMGYHSAVLELLDGDTIQAFIINDEFAKVDKKYSWLKPEYIYDIVEVNETRF
jgi:hypothetical protein